MQKPTRARLVVLCGVAFSTMFVHAPLLRAQAEVTTAPVATNAYDAFTLSCPTNMVVVGVSSRGAFPQGFDCSLYKADGHRFGAVTSVEFPGPADPMNKFLDPLWPKMPLSTASCPGDRAVTSLHTHVDPNHPVRGVDYIEVFCAGIGPNGGQTIATKAGSLPSSPTSTTTGEVTCPGVKFARGMVGVSSGLALVCIDAPLIANSVSSVSLSSQTTVSGTAVQGTVTLNGYAVGATSVVLSVTGAPGAFLPASVTVPDGARFATFQVQSAAGTAGCSTVKATIGATTVNDPLIFTPAPPIGASFSFALQPGSSSLLWAAPSTITAVVVLPPTKGVLAVGDVKGTPTVTFQSDQPNILAIQPGTQHVMGDTVKVSMSALTGGCAVVTATVNGVMWRKTLRLAAGF
jgi:hypothetical protein